VTNIQAGLSSGALKRSDLQRRELSCRRRSSAATAELGFELFDRLGNGHRLGFLELLPCGPLPFEIDGERLVDCFANNGRNRGLALSCLSSDAAVPSIAEEGL
jgi:hypothetical protein